MPQFAQIDTFASQIFWLLVTFSILYILMSRVVLPRIAETLSNRRNKIEDDLGKADALKAKAESVQAAYEASLAKATEEARAAHREAYTKIAERSDKEHAALAEKLAVEAAAADARIAKSKADALEELQAASVDVVQAATERLIGVSVDEATAKAALGSAKG